MQSYAAEGSPDGLFFWNFGHSPLFRMPTPPLLQVSSCGLQQSLGTEGRWGLVPERVCWMWVARKRRWVVDAPSSGAGCRSLELGRCRLGACQWQGTCGLHLCVRIGRRKDTLLSLIAKGVARRWHLHSHPCDVHNRRDAGDGWGQERFHSTSAREIQPLTMVILCESWQTGLARSCWNV